MTKKIILKLQVSFFKCNFVCRLVEERCETGEDRVQQLPAIPTGTGTVYTVKLWKGINETCHIQHSAEGAVGIRVGRFSNLDVLKRSAELFSIGYHGSKK